MMALGTVLLKIIEVLTFKLNLCFLLLKQLRYNTRLIFLTHFFFVGSGHYESFLFAATTMGTYYLIAKN